MAIVTIRQFLNFQWNQSDGRPLIDLFFSAVDDGSGNTESRTIVDGSEHTVVEGIGLSVDENGIFDGGTVTAIHVYEMSDGLDKSFEITGLNIDVAAAREAWEADDTPAPWTSADRLFFDASAVDPDGGAGIGTFYGSVNADSLVGSNGFEELVGDAGNDTIKGLGGKDTLWGDGGDDSVDGGSGDDALHGHIGVDTLIGGTGNDYLQGWDGTDSLLGGDNNDSLIGGSGKDTIDGGNGVDLVWYDDKTQKVEVTLSGGDWVYVKVKGVTEDKIRNVENVSSGSAGDKLTGDSHANSIWGNDGDDTIAGSGGNDWLVGNKGTDSLLGGDGADTLMGGAGKDLLDGGAGKSDAADFEDMTKRVEVTLNGSSYATVKVNGVTDDKIRNFEDLWGGSAGDKLTGDGHANFLAGNSGNDTLSGGAGNDTLVGGPGSDQLTGGSGSDHFAFYDGPAEKITDFEINKDKLDVYGANFLRIGSSLSSAEFRLGTSAKDSNDHIIYDRHTGSLYYDADGHGGASQILIGTLTNKAAIDYQDFHII